MKNQYWSVVLAPDGHHSFCSTKDTVEEAIAEAKGRGYETIFGVKLVIEPTDEEAANLDVTEQEYYAAQHQLEKWIEAHTPEYAKKLLKEFFDGQLDVGISEGLTPDQIVGCTLYLRDLVVFAVQIEENGVLNEQPRDVYEALNIVLDLYDLQPAQRTEAKAKLLRELESYG